LDTWLSDIDSAARILSQLSFAVVDTEASVQGSFISESGTMEFVEGTTGNTTSSKITTFRDIDNQQLFDMSGELDSTYKSNMNIEDDFGDFFSRPLRIGTFSWAPGATLLANILPWSAYLANPRVANRMSNFTNLRANLHLKFMINGNQFYYGKAIASYVPLPSFNLDGTHVAGVAGFITLATQRPHVFLDPCNSAGGEIIVPYFFYKDSINLTIPDAADVGIVNIESINVLRAANASTTNLNISVFAWLTNVQLSGPTRSNISGLVAQSGEYKLQGLISRPMTAVADSLGKLSSTFPRIAPYAIATQIVANLAKFLGFSSPINLEPFMNMKPRHVTNLANFDVADNSIKLSMDSKQELTVDPRTVGLSDIDEMSFDYISNRFNYLNTTTWSYTATPDTALQSYTVFPFHTVVGSTATVYPSYSLPGLFFEYWRGDITFKIEVAASNFHKGRLLITYDPNVLAVTPEPVIQYTYVMDIAEAKEAFITCKWNQPIAMGARPLGFDDASTVARGFGTAFTSSKNDNGVINISVLNELTSPQATVTDPVYINVYCKVEPGIRWTNLNARCTRLYFKAMEVQSGTMDCAKDDQCPNTMETDVLFGESNIGPHFNKVFAGEDIRSFRQVFKRYFQQKDYPIPLTAGYYEWGFADTIFPRARGYNTNFGNQWTYSYQNPLNVLSYAFAGYRGAIRHKYITLNTGSKISAICTLPQDSTIGWSQVGTVITQSYTQTGANSTNNGFLLGQKQLQDSSIIFSAGPAEVQMTGVNPVLEVEFPFYSRCRFHPVSAELFESAGVAAALIKRFCCYFLKGIFDTSGGSVSLYVSSGEDFNLHFFTGLPPCVTLTPPTPVP